MTTRPLLTAAVAILGVASLHAQTVDDALRYSESFPLGTARSLGTANSMSALGADWSAVAANPAGLAAFRKNDFAITTAGIITGSTSPIYDGQGSSGAERGTDLALPQVSLVLTRSPIGSRWTQFNFGVGVSQSNRFEERIGFAGDRPGSITDAWLDEANLFGVNTMTGNRIFDGEVDGFPLFLTDPVSITDLEFFNTFSADLAFVSGILIPGDTTDNPDFTTDYDLARGSTNGFFSAGPALTKSGIVRREGRNAAIDLSFGANFDEKLLFGATFALSRLRYESTFNYREADEADVAGAFGSLAYNDFSIITGTGIQVRVGAIYRASQALRLGLAYHSPNWINIEDSFDANLAYTFTDSDGVDNTNEARPPEASVIEYDFRSPSQYKASAAALIGKRGFVSAELTYLDFAGARFGAPDDADGPSEEFVNEVNDGAEGIASTLSNAVQVRLGGEVNLAPAKLRAGFQYIGAPRAGEDAVLGFNAGAGVRRNRFSLDLGYQALIRPDRSLSPYSFPEATADGPGAPVEFPRPLVTYTPISHTVALTLGWKLVSL